MNDLDKNVEPVRSTHRLWLWMVFTALVGVLDSLWLMILHYSLGGLSQSTCTINAKLSCDVLSEYRFSQVGNVPVALVSLVFYLVVAFISIAGKRSFWLSKPRAASYLWFLSWLSVLASLYMIIISVFVLKKVCPYCSILYVVSLAFLYLAHQLARDTSEHKLNQLRVDICRWVRNKWFWGLCCLGLSVALGVNYVLRPQGKVSSEKSSILSEENRTLGSSMSPIHIVEFSDFQCPGCKMAAETLKELERSQRGRVRITFKFYPWDKDCNPRLKRQMHEGTCLASQAAYCSSLQGKFWIYHDYLFANASDLSSQRLKEFGQAIGLDMVSFLECLTSKKARRVVRADIDEANGLYVEATPTIFINGQKYEGPLTVSALEETIQELSSVD